jgi:hypothetical protein
MIAFIQILTFARDFQQIGRNVRLDPETRVGHLLKKWSYSWQECVSLSQEKNAEGPYNWDA